MRLSNNIFTNCSLYINIKEKKIFSVQNMQKPMTQNKICSEKKKKERQILKFQSKQVENQQYTSWNKETGLGITRLESLTLLKQHFCTRPMISQCPIKLD